MKILIVEDENIWTILIEKEMARMGHECHIAKNGLEAYEKLKKDSSFFDVIISDFNMPEMNGLELRLKIESDLDSCPPVVLFSAHSGPVLENEKHRQLFYDIVGDKCLDTLMDCIKKIVDRKGRDKQKRSDAVKGEGIRPKRP